MKQELPKYQWESERYLSELMFHSIVELAAALEPEADDTPLAWMYTQGDKEIGRISVGIWGRVGSFYPVKETFVDAFDREPYQTKIWKLADSPDTPEAVPALELNAGGTQPQGGCTLHTVGELKAFLRSVDASRRLLAPSRNFELKGALVDKGVCLYFGQDTCGIEYLFLLLD